MLNGDSVPTCDREESFVEIYAAIGDAEAQQAIREENPDKYHCKLLTDPKYGPSFCPSCPNNPHLPVNPITKKPNPKHELLRLCEEHAVVALESIVAAGRLRSGFSVGPLSFRQEEAVQIAGTELETAKLRYQGQFIAAEISKVLAQAFGSK